MKKQKKPIITVPPKATFLFKKGSSQTGILLLHGFTGTPAEMRYVAEKLNEAGATVYVPRYPGHGTNLLEMANSSVDAWFTAAREALFELKSHCQDVYIAGLSMGGIFAILLAREFAIEKIALMSVPCTLKEKTIYGAPIAGLFTKILWVPNKTKGVCDEAARKEHICYDDGIPVVQSWQLFKTIKKAMKALPQIESEVLIIQSKNDNVIPQHSAHYIYSHLGSAHKQLIWLHKSFHAITVDIEKDAVAQHCIDFFMKQ
ncbi:MAG: alpha/beta fold hydrolase [Spirochaetes bacterium]|nr:alpha/beta fold hydrolase [Spirochaetota bacterium]